MANMMPGADVIDFAIGNQNQPQTILLNSNLGPLPSITGGEVTILGSSQGGAFYLEPAIHIEANGVVGSGLRVGGAGIGHIFGLAITGFTGSGIELANGAGTAGSEVVNCFIGTDLSGTAAGMGNGGSGVSITGANNTVRNSVICGNGSNGVEISGTAATQNAVYSCYIGVDKTGLVKLANGGSGVAISSSANTIGSLGATNKGNVISGNGSYGVELSGASNNKLIDNYIGLGADGATALGNTRSGVAFRSETTNNEISGFNVISGNGHQGVLMSGTSATGNKVYGAYIGTTKDGNDDRPNSQGGVKIDNGQGNFIGGTGAGQWNLISGNGNDGIGILGAEAKFNNVIGNIIGLDEDGVDPVPNTGDGIEITGSNNNIGAGGDSGRNVISGNEGCGIRIVGGTFNVVINNYIGTDLTGTLDRGNDQDGVFLDYGSKDNEIGGQDGANTRNVISGNGETGVRLRGSGDGTNTTRNTIAGNYIGLDKTGNNVLGNDDDGVHLERCTGNTIGGAAAAAANYIAGNGNAAGEFGVNMSIGTSNNLVQNNTIGKKVNGQVAPNFSGFKQDLTGLNQWLNNDHD